MADISALRQLSKASIAQAAQLYKPKDVIRWQTKPSKGSSGTRKFVGTNPYTGATIAYSLGKTAREIEIEILDLEGQVIKRFEDIVKTKGLHMLKWDLRLKSGRRSARSGDYLVKMVVDGENYKEKISIKIDPNISPVARAVLENQVESNEETDGTN